MLDIHIVEKEIPVPWGHISAKIWGNETDPPVLVFHGIMDNAGSFDHLIPLLPQHFYYICIDLPGHGLSSHFPPHLPIFSLSYIMVYKLIVEYFQRNRYVIMGHSYGGQIGFVFAQLYPQYVEKLILLDTVTFIPILPPHFKNYLVDKFDSHLSLVEKLSVNKPPPTYTYEEALEKLQFGRYTPVTAEAAVALSHRGLIRVENGQYRFTADQRLKNFINPVRDFRCITETLKQDPVTCPVLIVLGKESTAQILYMRSLLTYLKKLRNVTIKIVEGNHDVHSEYPEVVAPHVSTFLLRKKSKL